ncbi:hypothetical protein OS493_015252 [Desmophyllum pertusum]|uniref:Uncharacterized protein n=1 Tax=Desmophyllum pertusum TaxID=174260 RepID=A0A9X0CZQ9_9CNID|nr:hypothetical protein OS493_015252 [Desmophyllum pertusum]
MSLYSADYSCKCKRKPVRQLPLRPSSVSRRNNPHPARDFPDTKVLQELKKDHSVETVLLAKAKEKALSKKTWVDELMAEKDNRNTSRNIEILDQNECMQFIAKVLEDTKRKKQMKPDSSKDFIHGYEVNMADHFV